MVNLYILKKERKETSKLLSKKLDSGKFNKNVTKQMEERINRLSNEINRRKADRNKKRK